MIKGNDFDQVGVDVGLTCCALGILAILLHTQILLGFDSLGLGCLDVQGATSPGVAEEQATGGIFILGVVLDEAKILRGLDELYVRDVALDGALEGVTAEFEFSLT